MRITDAKKLIASVLLHNLELAEKGKSVRHRLIPALLGDPGVGKTSAFIQVADEYKLPYFDTIVAQYDAGELGGFGIPKIEELIGPDGKPVKDKNGKTVMIDRVRRARPDHMPDLDVPAGIWNLDELAQAFLANQNIVSQLVNEHRIGRHDVSPGITIGVTSNKPENKAGTTSMPSHLVDRLTLIYIEPDFEEFLEYAQAHQINPLVRVYLQNNPASLHKFEPGAKSCPTPRSWERAGTWLDRQLPDHIQTEALMGTIGEGETPKFQAWIRVKDKMPKLEDILKKPQEARVFGNEDADVLYLLLANLADVAKESNIEAILTYIRRLPNQEFTAYWAKDTFRQKPDLLKNKHVVNWKMNEGVKLFSGED